MIYIYLSTDLFLVFSIILPQKNKNNKETSGFPQGSPKRIDLKEAGDEKMNDII